MDKWHIAHAYQLPVCVCVECIGRSAKNVQIDAIVNNTTILQAQDALEIKQHYLVWKILLVLFTPLYIIFYWIVRRPLRYPPTGSLVPCATGYVFPTEYEYYNVE